MAPTSSRWSTSGRATGCWPVSRPPKTAASTPSSAWNGSSTSPSRRNQYRRGCPQPASGRAAAPFQPDPGGRRDLAYRVVDPTRDDEQCLMGQRDLDGLSPHTTQPTASAASPIGTVVQHAKAKGSGA